MVISCIFPVHCSPTVYKKDAPEKRRFSCVFLYLRIKLKRKNRNHSSTREHSETAPELRSPGAIPEKKKESK